MHKVIDFGALRSELLSEFFASSEKNVAVLTDMMAIESLKQIGLQRYQLSLEILSRNDNRVVILKPSGVAARLRPNPAEFPNNLIDWDATKRFPSFCAQALLASRPQVIQHIDQNQNKARAFVASVGANIETLREAVSATLGNFPPSVLSDLRTGRTDRYHPDILRHIRASGEMIALGQFAKLFPGNTPPPLSDLPSWLPLRYSIALYSLAVKWSIAGGHSSARPDKLRNDGIDMFYVAYGTAFDGVISEDTKLIEIYHLVRAALSA